MTSITPGYNPYAQYGSAYARTAAATQPSLLDALNAGDASNASDPNAATNLTLSDAAKAQLAAAANTPDFATVTDDARAALDKLYAAAKVTGLPRRRKRRGKSHRDMGRAARRGAEGLRRREAEA